MILNKCINCGKEIKPEIGSSHQIYCCKKCGNEYRRKKKNEKEQIKIEPFRFICSQCGKTITVIDIKDKRTRFCSEACERKYWKHPPENETSCNINYHNINDYISYEKYTNEVF